MKPVKDTSQSFLPLRFINHARTRLVFTCAEGASLTKETISLRDIKPMLQSFKRSEVFLKKHKAEYFSSLLFHKVGVFI